MPDPNPASPPPPRPSRPVPPTISLPPRSSFESFNSPGPMTMVSNFFSDDADIRSFSQLLAGAMASPAAITPDSASKDADFDKKFVGFKRNRPVDLVIAQSPSGFMFPSGFSPSGLLNSPGFSSALESPFGMSHQQALAHVTAQAALSQSHFNHFQPEYHKEQSQMPTETSDLDDSRIGSPESVSISQPDTRKPSAGDGYNWRKYGQKQVKASEHPRSYYKCTHLNCPMKKIVGQSLDGQITDIVYKGQHNHEPPRVSQPAKDGSDVIQPKISRSEIEEPVAARDQVSNHQLITNEASDEPNPKRRNTEVGSGELVSSSQKAVGEAKIVVQTRSEVDLLDDGFKWRKYGQKVVKGNTYPRSYYKCTYTGCIVRKHVERASSDPKSVVTTYEGKHNHDIPVSRHRGYNVVGHQKGTTAKPSNQRPIELHLKEEKITV